MPPSKARKTVAPQVHQRAEERDQAQRVHGDVRPRVAREPDKGATSRATKAKADGANGIVSPRGAPEPNPGGARKRVVHRASRAAKTKEAARPEIARESAPGAKRGARKRVVRGASRAAKAKEAARPEIARESAPGAKRGARKRVAKAAVLASMQARSAKAEKAGVAKLSHLDARGQARMVEISAKPITARTAVARAELRMLPQTMRVLRSGRAAKGDVLAVARVAGIQAAKRTPELIPLCHAIALTKSEIAFQFSKTVLTVDARVSALDRTGAEMEALTAASIAALTVYDMLKAIDRGMVIESVRLEEKRGGRSGHWVRS